MDTNATSGAARTNASNSDHRSCRESKAISFEMVAGKDATLVGIISLNDAVAAVAPSGGSGGIS